MVPSVNPPPCGPRFQQMNHWWTKSTTSNPQCPGGGGHEKNLYSVLTTFFSVAFTALHPGHHNNFQQEDALLVFKEKNSAPILDSCEQYDTLYPGLGSNLLPTPNFKWNLPSFSLINLIPFVLEQVY